MYDASCIYIGDQKINLNDSKSEKDFAENIKIIISALKKEIFN